MFGLSFYVSTLWTFAFMYVAMDFLAFTVFHLTGTLVLIVIHRDFLYYFMGVATIER